MRHPRLKLLGVAALLASFPALLLAEIPRMSESELTEEASNAFTGRVIRTYQTKAKPSEHFEKTYGVAEISVTDVAKGQNVRPGDTTFVRYWNQRWIGEGNPMPGHYGHWNVPKSGDTVIVFVKGDRKSGYDVLSPNGFFDVKSPKVR